MEGQIIVLLFAGLLLSFFVKKLLYTPKKLHKRIIEKINKKGYELVSIDTPKLFDTGPFLLWNSKFLLAAPRCWVLVAKKTSIE